MAELADEPTTLMFHAEMIPPITESVGDDVQVSLPPVVPHGPLNAYMTFLESRPPSFETYAIEEILSMAHLAPNLALHIVHLSAMQAIPLLRGQKVFVRGSAVNMGVPGFNGEEDFQSKGFVGKGPVGKLLLEPRQREGGLVKQKSWFRKWVYDWEE